jgi:hypothetical protein
MARVLKFRADDKEYSVNPTMIDRKKLYGWTELLAMDDLHHECKLVMMDKSGTLIPKGGTGLGILTPDGKWVERSQLIAVLPDGTPAKLLPSSYSATVDLTEKVSVETFLEHSITAFYQLEQIDVGLVEWIGNDIYRFDYRYRDCYAGKSAFLLAGEINSEGNKPLFMMIGVSNEVEMLCLEQVAFIEDDTNQEEEEGNDDEMDFSMF